MKISKDFLFHTVRRGQARLQIPEVGFGHDFGEMVEVADDEVMYVHGYGNNERPKTKNEGGYLHFSRKGYERFKVELLAEYAKAGGSPAEFERRVEDWFAFMSKKLDRECKNLKRKLEELEAAKELLKV